MRGKFNEAEPVAARQAGHSPPRSLILKFGRDLCGLPGPLMVAAAVFLLVAGIGAALSYIRDPPDATGPGGHDLRLAVAFSVARRNASAPRGLRGFPRDRRPGVCE